MNQTFAHVNIFVRTQTKPELEKGDRPISKTFLSRSSIKPAVLPTAVIICAFRCAILLLLKDFLSYPRKSIVSLWAMFFAVSLYTLGTKQPREKCPAADRHNDGHRPDGGGRLCDGSLNPLTLSLFELTRMTRTSRSRNEPVMLDI